MRDINPSHIERFRNHRLDEGVAPKTVGLDVKILSIGLRRAEKFGYLEKNPVSAVQLPRMTSSEREIFSMAEVDQLIAAAPNLDWQTMIYLGFYTGARLGDCATMTWDNIDTENGRLVYHQRKTDKPVVVPLHHRLLSHLHHVAQSFVTGPLCPSVAAKGPGGKRGLSESFKRIVVRACRFGSDGDSREGAPAIHQAILPFFAPLVHVRLGGQGCVRGSPDETHGPCLVRYSPQVHALGRSVIEA